MHMCYRTKLGSTRPMCNKANLLTPVCGEGKYNVYCKAPSVRPSKETWQLMLKKPELPDGF